MRSASLVPIILSTACQQAGTVHIAPIGLVLDEPVLVEVTVKDASGAVLETPWTASTSAPATIEGDTLRCTGTGDGELTVEAAHTFATARVHCRPGAVVRHAVSTSVVVGDVVALKPPALTPGPDVSWEAATLPELLGEDRVATRSGRGSVVWRSGGYEVTQDLVVREPLPSDGVLYLNQGAAWLLRPDGSSRELAPHRDHKERQRGRAFAAPHRGELVLGSGAVLTGNSEETPTRVPEADRSWAPWVVDHDGSTWAVKPDDRTLWRFEHGWGTPVGSSVEEGRQLLGVSDGVPCTSVEGHGPVHCLRDGDWQEVLPTGTDQDDLWLEGGRLHATRALPDGSWEVSVRDLHDDEPLLVKRTPSPTMARSAGSTLVLVDETGLSIRGTWTADLPDVGPQVALAIDGSWLAYTQLDDGVVSVRAIGSDGPIDTRGAVASGEIEPVSWVHDAPMGAPSTPWVVE